MKKLLLTLATIAFFAIPGFSQVITKESKMNYEDTIKSIESKIIENKFRLFAKISQSEAAKEMGVQINPGMVFIFGNPKVGSVLMKENPQWFLELPLKVSVYEDSNKKAFISIYDMKALAKEHNVSEQGMKIIEKMSGFLQSLLK